jgi:hypothetical protein
MTLTFAMYSGQWLAVIGFCHPSMVEAGLPGLLAAWLTVSGCRHTAGSGARKRTKDTAGQLSVTV